MQVDYQDTLPKSAHYAFTAEWWYSPASTRIDHYHIAMDKSKNYWVLWLTWFDDNWFTDEEKIITNIPISEAKDIQTAATMLIAKAWKEEISDYNLDPPEFISQTGMLDMEDIESVVNDIWDEDGEAK